MGAALTFTLRGSAKDAVCAWKYSAVGTALIAVQLGGIIWALNSNAA